MKKMVWLLVSLLLFGTLSGCGLEVLMMGLPTGGVHEAPKPEEITKVSGQAEGLADADVVLKIGQVAVASGKTDGQGAFSLELPKSTDFSNLIVEVTKGSVVQWAVIPTIPKGKVTESGPIDAKSTTVTLLLQAVLSAKGLELFNYPSDGVKAAAQKLSEDLQQKETMKKLLAMVENITKAAGSLSGESALRAPQLKTTGTNKLEVEQSALNVSDIDYCGTSDGTGCKDGAEGSTTPFDQALLAAIQPSEFKLPNCNYQDTIRVIFTVTVDPSKAKDGNCTTVKQFKHAKRYGGTSCEKCKVYITGGVHKDSGFTDRQQQIAQQLSNWEPNRLAMFDDGTNGDLVAKDGIWTLTMTLPAPKATGKSCSTNNECDKGQSCWNKKCYEVLRLGYKYTYGLNSDVWGGTEEFPGNQRLLEVVDHNGDGFVARHDVFADETNNKDKVNTLKKKGATGLVCFVTPPKEQCSGDNPAQFHPDCGCKTDQNGDGVPDVREGPWDLDNDCKTDGFRVYANAQPLTQSCSY